MCVPRPVCALIGAVLVLVGASCGERPADMTMPKPAAVAGSPAARVVDVEIYADRLEPSQIVLQAGESVRLRVVNRSTSQCLFFVADLLANLRAAPNSSVEMAFAVPAPAASPATRRSAPMGCQSDTVRVGHVIVEPRPS